jgi:hypothetical protein
LRGDVLVEAHFFPGAARFAGETAGRADGVNLVANPFRSGCTSTRRTRSFTPS